MRIFRRLRALRKDSRGLAAVELALLAPILALILGGIVDLGRYIWFQTEITQALRAGMQYAMTNPNDTAGINSVIRQSTALWPSQDFTTVGPTYTCTCSDTSAISCVTGTCANGLPKQYYINMGVTYSYQPMIGTMRGLLPNRVNDTMTLRTQ